MDISVKRFLCLVGGPLNRTGNAIPEKSPHTALLLMGFARFEAGRLRVRDLSSFRCHVYLFWDILGLILNGRNVSHVQR